MENIKYALVAIFIRLLYSGLEIVSKAALNNGINPHVFVFYRQAFAAAFLLPIAYFTKKLPPLSFRLGVKLFVHAFIGITMALNLYTIAFDYTTAYTVSAANNSMPVCTFLVAMLYGVETLEWRRSSGIAKLSGVGLFVVGTLVIALYKGPHLDPLHRQHNLINQASPSATAHRNIPALGAFLTIASNTFWAFWLVTQRQLLKEYPSKLGFTAFQCLFSAISSFLLAFLFQRDFSNWKLGFNVGLVSVLYCGIVITGFSFYMQSWLIEKKGPVFLALFTPITLLATLICSGFLLREVINFGSLLGGLFMVGGLYSVLWGKSREQKDNELPIVQEEAIGGGGLVKDEMEFKVNEASVVLDEKELINKILNPIQEEKHSLDENIENENEEEKVDSVTNN